jgi:hypothetical protein
MQARHTQAGARAADRVCAGHDRRLHVSPSVLPPLVIRVCSLSLSCTACGQAEGVAFAYIGREREPLCLVCWNVYAPVFVAARRKGNA